MGYFLAALSVWCYASYRDVRDRQVPNLVWIILASLASLRALYVGVNILALVVSVTVMAPLAVILYGRYQFGGADAKAILVASMLYPSQIGVFLIGAGVGMVPFVERDEIPAIVPIAFGALCATVAYWV